MKLRFLWVRAVCGIFVAAAAAPVNLPMKGHAVSFDAFAADDDDARPASTHAASDHAATRTAYADPGSRDLRQDGHFHIRLDPELPCDSAEWATSSLFGPPSRAMAALGMTPGQAGGTSADSELAAALDGNTSGQNAASSAFGSIFGNSTPGGGGFGTGGGTTGGTGGTGTSGTGDGGPFTGGGSTGGGTGVGTGGTTGGGPVLPPPGNTSDAGAGTGGGSGSGTGGSGTGDTGGSGSGGAGTGTPPIDPGSGTDIPPIIPPAGGDGGTGPIHGSGGGNTTGGGESVTAAVPEPASWMTMICGFGAIGAMLRRRRPVTA